MKKLLFWSAAALCGASFAIFAYKAAFPFALAFALAYLLYPLTKNNLKIPRSVFAIFLSIAFVALVSSIFAVILPTAKDQIALLLEKIPYYKIYLQKELPASIHYKLEKIDPALALKAKDYIKDLVGGSFSLFSGVTQNIWNYAAATVNLFLPIVLVPIILAYLLKDWPYVIAFFDSLVPVGDRKNAGKIFKEISDTLSAYARGQFNICLILSCFYCAGLFLIGFDVALPLGILSGFSVIAPFIGIFFSFLLSCAVGYAALGFKAGIVPLFFLYGSGSLLESYFLAPKIIGGKIGLHPLWIMFAIFAFAHSFGPVGVFVAVPVAGILKIFLKYAIKYYKSTSIYED